MAHSRKRKSKTKPAARPKGGRAAEAARSDDKVLRAHLAKLLDADTAHVNFEKTIGGWSAVHRAAKPDGTPYNAWQLLEHLRIAQWDILEFCRNPKHVSPEWPSGYWPSSDVPPNAGSWDESVKAFRAECEAMRKLVENPKTNLFARIPHGTGKTVLREALLLADHNAYHFGQLVLLRKQLGVWPSQ
jgi:DinB superfamily